MGVDLETYRGRIGTYRHSCGQDVITVTCVINFSNGLKTIGAVLFIGVLLLIAGIESNPGPGGILSSYFFIAIVCVIIGLLLQIIEWKINALYLVCLLFVGGSFCYWTEQTTHKEKKDIASNNSDNECITQVQSSADSGLNQSTPSVVKHSTEQHEEYMITEEEEYFLRASILLLKGGRLMSKEILYKELRKAGGNLDVLLKNHETTFKHKFVKEQKKKLFPDAGVTDVETWDLAMLIKVSLTVFNQSLNDDEKKGLMSLKSMRDKIYAHTCSSSLSAGKYEDIRKELENALTSLSNRLSEKLKDDCYKIIQECTTGPISPSLKAELTKQIEDTEDLMQAVINKLRSQNEILFEMKKDIMDKLNKFSVTEDRSERIIKVIDTELKLSGAVNESKDIDFAERIITMVINKAIKKVGNENDYPRIRSVVDKILKDIENMSDVEILQAEHKCILLKFRCTTYIGILNMLMYLESRSFLDSLNDLTLALSSAIPDVSDKFRLDATVTPECMKDLLDELRAKTMERKKYERAIRVPIKVESVQGIEHIWSLFETGGASKKLNELSEAVSDELNTKVTVTPSVNLKQVQAAIKDAGEKPATLAQKAVEDNASSPQRHQSKSVDAAEMIHNDPPTKLRVRGLPPNMTSEVLALFFENEHRHGGGRVKEVTIEAEGNSAVVEFEKATAVEVVVGKQPIIIFGTTVEIEVIEAHETYLQPPKSRTIKVSGVPKGTHEEILTKFFENEKGQGGGKVTDVCLYEKKGFALVDVKDDLVEIVLKKQPIYFLECEVNVERLVLSVYQSSDEETSKLLVTGVPENVTEELMVNFFENEKRQGGGNVNNVIIDKEKRSAVVEFKEAKALDKVLQKRPIVIMGTEVNVEVFDGKCPQTTQNTRIVVSGLPRDMSVEFLTILFENEKRFGGGPVKNVVIDEGTNSATVEFEEPQAVTNVLQKRPVIVQGTEVQISTSVKEPERSESTGNVKSVEVNEDKHTAIIAFEEEKDCLRFKQVLEKLGLADKYPSKISIRDVIAVDLDEANDQKKQVHLSDIPWIILQRLISAHSDARDITTTNDTDIGNETDFDGTVSFLSEVPDESENLSPIDIFSVVFQCCDPLMKQVFFQKLYLCKMAVPFLYQSWAAQVQKPVVSVWPLRCLAIENKTTCTGNQFSSKKVDMLELSSKVLAFARFGRPRYSKSKLLNSLLSSNGCKTFFNIDCPSGMTPRYICNGQIEMFWLPTVGDKKDKFQDAVTFLNMRGDLNKHFASDVCDFIAKLADAVVIVIDLHSIREEKDMVKHYLMQFASVILIIANPLKKEDVDIVQDFERNVKASKNDISLRALSTHQGTVEQNVVDMVSKLSKHITSQLKSSTCRSLQERLYEARIDSVNVGTDEEEDNCKYGKSEAEKLIKQMQTDGEPRVWKQVLTPVHCKLSKKLGQLKKKREREKGLTEGENIERQMTDIRIEQTKSITTTVKYFVNILTNDPESYIKLELVLGWLHFFIEREKRRILPQLMYKNRLAWEQLKELKSRKEQTTADDIAKQEKLITDLEGEIDAASFSVEHFFREIGHIYEALLELDVMASDVGLPEIDKIAYVVGRLVAGGHQLELIDGESFYMPFRWTHKVLQHVNNVIKSGKVMTLSVLGLQGSGKSTLLNTMFGSQFSTRTGRCTRGIHVQLVPAKTGTYTSAKTPFDYVLVVDTEGLRSPELSHIQHEHDNELATVITGIGDITMLNIMGENTSEIRDILQVIIHAFLRLKMTNRNLDIRKSCTFIHQNVTDTSASDNMISGLSKLIKTLDDMTEESAKSEGILEITTFNQVIEFDINTQVWYLKNLWQGNPPMARVNTEYSERVVDMKCRILQKALNMEKKSYKSIVDILVHAHSLWKGVLNEDFVFSFRNSLEIRAYMEMELFVQDHLWQLERVIHDKMIDKSQSKFSDCNQKDKLRAQADDVISELKYLLYDEKIKAEKEIFRYFEINKYKDIIIQWKSTQQGRVDNVCIKLERTIREQIEKKYIKRSVEILTISSHEKHEEEVRIKSIEVANKYKGQRLSQAAKDSLFAEIWNSFMNKIDTTECSTDTKRKSMKSIFIDCLTHLFEKHSAVLKANLQASAQLAPLQDVVKLTGTFGKTGIEDKDISLSLIQKGTDFIKLTDAMAHTTTWVNQIFSSFDEKIKNICQVNDEITEMNVNELLHDLQKSIHDILTGKGKYDFKPTFKVKICIHVSRYAHPIFEKHNEDYFKTQGVAVRLEQYKEQQKIRFEAHLSNRASEDIVAQLFSNIIGGFAKEWTLENIPNKVTDDLHSHLPSVKNRVIIEICKTLMTEDNFNEFVSYLNAPNAYARRWIYKRATSRLFDKKSDVYFAIARSSVNSVFGKAETCLVKLKDKFCGKQSPTIDEWVNEFIYLSKDGDEQLSIPIESFRNVRKEVKVIENIQYLTDAIIANMLESKDKVINEFRAHNKYNVMWENVNPIERITNKIWGCREQCKFCGEPCAKNEDHEGDEHYSIQHRPACCLGVCLTVSVEACLEACNVMVNSDGTHICKVFAFACNKEKREPCSAKSHPFRKYKDFLPNWDIPPSSSMADSSKFWMWFVATYSKKLCDMYCYRLDHLPSSWEKITKEQAEESLTKTYTA